MCLTEPFAKPVSRREKAFVLFIALLFNEELLSSSVKTAAVAASTLQLPLFTSLQ